MRRTLISLAIVFLLVAAALPAQRGRGRGAARGGARVPAGRGHSTASARSRARSVAEKGDRKRTGVDVGWMDRPTTAPVAPADPGAAAPRRNPALVEQERTVLAGLRERYGRMKTLTYRGYLSVKPKGKSSKRITFDYFGKYDRENNRGFHRFSIKTRPPRRIIIHEVFGGASEGWMISDHVTPLANPMTTRLLEGAPAIILDALPIEPSRYRLGLEGEGSHAGSSVWYLAGACKDRATVARLALRKSMLLPIHAQVFSGGTLVREITASRLELSGGVLAFSQRHVTSLTSDTTIDLVCRDRRVNTEISQGLFTKPE